MTAQLSMDALTVKIGARPATSETGTDHVEFVANMVSAYLSEMARDAKAIRRLDAQLRRLDERLDDPVLLAVAPVGSQAWRAACLHHWRLGYRRSLLRDQISRRGGDAHRFLDRLRGDQRHALIDEMAREHKGDELWGVVRNDPSLNRLPHWIALIRAERLAPEGEPCPF